MNRISELDQSEVYTWQLDAHIRRRGARSQSKAMVLRSSLNLQVPTVVVEQKNASLHENSFVNGLLESMNIKPHTVSSHYKASFISLYTIIVNYTPSKFLEASKADEKIRKELVTSLTECCTFLQEKLGKKTKPQELLYNILKRGGVKSGILPQTLLQEALFRYQIEKEVGSSPESCLKPYYRRHSFVTRLKSMPIV